MSQKLTDKQILFLQIATKAMNQETEKEYPLSKLNELVGKRATISFEVKGKENERTILITEARCDANGSVIISVFSSHTESCMGITAILIDKKGGHFLLTYVQKEGHGQLGDKNEYLLKSVKIA